LPNVIPINEFKHLITQKVITTIYTLFNLALYAVMNQ
jgi:hypothetical protein